MLNRAPTLHRLGIQAFEPVLVEGRAIKLHPLVCTAFNADFDGDQMAVHVPRSAEAQTEARVLMLSANNLLRPQDGSPVTIPSQDMILGAYYLTFMREEGETGHIFADKDEAMLAYDSGVVTLHTPIKVRMYREVDGEMRHKLVQTTVGRLIYNEAIPQDLGFVDRSDPETMFEPEVNFVVGKKQLGKIIDKCITKHGFTESARVLDDIKDLGYHYSTRGSLTVAIADMTVPAKKYELIGETEKEIIKIDRQYRRGLITNDERYRLTVSAWEKTTGDVTKALQEQVNLELPGYLQYWYSAEKKGYSGTAIFTKHEPLSVRYGVGVEELDHEGRLITLEYENFFLVTCYTPNAQDGLKRIDHRMAWEDAFRKYLTELDQVKPVIICGDLNVAHNEIDLKNPKTNRGNAGFSDEERGKFGELLEAGFTDSFRYLYPELTGAYSWWSYRANARKNNAGWRIDYFLVSNRLQEQILEAKIHSDIYGSDHCPVEIGLNLEV